MCEKISALADLAFGDSDPMTRGISRMLMPSPIRLSEVGFMGRPASWRIVATLAALYMVTEDSFPSSCRGTSERTASRPGTKAGAQCLGCVTFAPCSHPGSSAVNGGWFPSAFQAAGALKSMHMCSLWPRSIYGAPDLVQGAADAAVNKIGPISLSFRHSFPLG